MVAAEEFGHHRITILSLCVCIWICLPPPHLLSSWNRPAAGRRLQDLAQTFDLFAYPLYVCHFGRRTSGGGGQLFTCNLRKFTLESVHGENTPRRLRLG